MTWFWLHFTGVRTYTIKARNNECRSWGPPEYRTTPVNPVVYTVFYEKHPDIFYHNFYKFKPIFAILSLFESQMNSPNELF